MKKLIAALGLFITACSTTPTQVVVTIDAEMGVRAGSERLLLEIKGGNGRETAPSAPRFERTLTPGMSDPPYPFSMTLAPLDGDVGRSFSLTATAQTATGDYVGQTRVIGGYLDGETLRVNLLLEDACRTIRCEADETCKAGACVDARVVLTPPSRDAGTQPFTPRNFEPDVWTEAVGSISVATSATIDTTSGAVLVDGVASRDFAIREVDGVDDCPGIFALVVREFRVATGATVIVTGTRALAIIATGLISIDGSIDVGAHASVGGPGSIVRLAGGGYGSTGARQGCDSGTGIIPTFGDSRMTNLCGGSASDRMGSGGGGGAIQLTSQSSVTISDQGVIRAVGGGATRVSAAGGSGGGVLIQAPAVTIAGIVSVNGGGGASGGTLNTPWAGADGLTEARAAVGGIWGSELCGCSSSSSYGGGGKGAWQSEAAGPGGGGSRYGCCSYDTGCYSPGGGGGGAGRIRIDADVRDYRPGRVIEYPGLPGVFTEGSLR